MIFSIELTPEEEAGLQKMADRAGVTPQEAVKRVIQAATAEPLASLLILKQGFNPLIDLAKALAEDLPAAVGRSDQPRIPGLNAGQIWISPDFDDPLPDSFWLGEESDRV